ncbi:oligoribonuclease [Buchnera aphidicola (Ceratoglyphina bambusae)]|uniref:oligoribonuclease n=1 Tax=Buchnera aphidicola TaxID=9 RepID=UPI0031B84739
MNMKKNNLIWIDLEMTGLNPNNNFILEIAVVITDKNLNIKSKGISIPIHHKTTIINKMNTWNKRTHKKNGLIKKVKNSIYNEKMAEQKIIKFIKTFTKKKHSPMCGNSNFLDKIFLKKFMPTLLNYFHYRSIDVSTIKELSKRWNNKIYKKIKKKNNHSALKDIYESIKELIYYKKKFFNIEEE